ncbi:MAG: SDR family oxidoreductase [Alphaproteobacteria bacterium]
MAGVLDGKAVLVTGAGHGIGREIALLAAAEGAAVLVNDLGASTAGEGRDAKAAEAVVADIRAAGGKAEPNGGDVSSFQDASAMVAQAVQAFGRIDGVANIAGIARDGFFHKMTEADFDLVMNVHLKGTFNVSRAAADHFRAQESGAYVHTTSTAGLIGYHGMSNYAAAKMGIVGLSRGIAMDMARFGVRSNCMAPHAWSRMASTMVARTPEEERRVARQKQMDPAKIAALTVYLLSDLAKDVNGQIFGCRLNEVYLYNQSRIVRAMHRAEGWTPAGLHEHAMPAMRSAFTSMENSAECLAWDPI